MMPIMYKYTDYNIITIYFLLCLDLFLSKHTQYLNKFIFEITYDIVIKLFIYLFYLFRYEACDGLVV